MENPPTFTEEDVKEAGKWFNWLHQNASFFTDKPGVKQEDVKVMVQFYTWISKHIKLMESHIFEMEVLSKASDEEIAEAKKQEAKKTASKKGK